MHELTIETTKHSPKEADETQETEPFTWEISKSAYKKKFTWCCEAELVGPRYGSQMRHAMMAWLNVQHTGKTSASDVESEIQREHLESHHIMSRIHRVQIYMSLLKDGTSVPTALEIAGKRYVVTESPNVKRKTR